MTANSAPVESADTLSGFLAAGSGIYYYVPHVQISAAKPIPSLAVNGASGAQPKMIIVFGWMSAKAAHLQKYLDYYKALFPNSTIVVARSWPSAWWSSTKAREKYLEPMLRVLTEQGLFSDSSPSVLIHVFSNGGSFLASELSRMVRSRSLGIPPKGIPTSCIIFDSCPGTGDIWVSVGAFTAGMRSRIARFLLGTFFILALLVLIAVRTLLRRPHLIHDMRARINDPSVFSWTSKATPRLYLYSDADVMVPAKFVEEHIAEAKQKGLNVHTELFHGSAHVSHARQEPERYWGAVKSLWFGAVKLSQKGE
ncbi:hypothetical protein NM688_g4834 [Phlebia brevispora]|uniref:Uncharacterized protein n=1 Tax=Phlebia brevispora TaxID=194682 RepID=A0ACC1T1W2_9APHY|nr:hypothetical protein NM688_g4834 [Phlebia brevispora]